MTAQGLPFAHLNLRRNPFGQTTAEESARLATVDLRAVIPRFADWRFVLQLLGDKGFGKTTHSLALRLHFPHAAYVHIPEGERRRIPRGEPMIVDEAQRLSWTQTHWLFRQSVPIVLSTHYDYSWLLRRYGRVVETRAVGQHLTAPWLRAVVNRRISAARRGPGLVPHVQRTTAQRLLDEHGPNVRAIFETLYHRFQGLRDIQNV